MPSGASQRNRKDRRARRARRKQRKLVVDMRYDLLTGQIVCSATRVAYGTRMAYLDDHDLLADTNAAALSEEALHALVAAAEESGSTEDWRQALLLLAHHRSEHAKLVLDALEDRVPSATHDYWELAYAEAVGWLGFEFIRDENGVAHVLPAGTVFRESCEGELEQRPLN
jgi:hypothetical protein